MIRGESMEPNFQSNDLLIVSKFAYAADDPQRGDVIVFHAEDEQNRDFLKRIIGLPGEQVMMESGQIYINGLLIGEPYIHELCTRRVCRNREWFLSENEYFVLGDNRNISQDSVDFGPIHRDQIIGRAWLRYDGIFDWDILPNLDYANES